MLKFHTARYAMHLLPLVILPNFLHSLLGYTRSLLPLPGGVWMSNCVPLGEVTRVPPGMSKIAGREHPELLSPQLLFRFAVMEVN